MNRTKASVAQLAYLSEYMEANNEMATGHLKYSLQGRADLEKQWDELAKKLNSLGGAIKTTTKWKQVWRDLKNNVKKKASFNRNEFRGYGSGSTGNGPAVLKSFTAVEDKVFSVMGPVAVFGMEDVPITEPITQVIECPVPSLDPNAESILQQDTVGPSPLHQPPEPQPRTRKRKRIAAKEDNFDKKLLQIEEQKLLLLKERNNIEEKKNKISEEQNVLLYRIADLLQKAVDTLSNNK